MDTVYSNDKVSQAPRKSFQEMTLSELAKWREDRTATIDEVKADNFDLRAALADVLRHCVTVDGFKDAGKGRTPEQQEAYTKAVKLLRKGQYKA